MNPSLLVSFLQKSGATIPRMPPKKGKGAGAKAAAAGKAAKNQSDEVCFCDGASCLLVHCMAALGLLLIPGKQVPGMKREQHLDHRTAIKTRPPYWVYC